MTDDAKTRILSETNGDAMRAALERIDAAYFTVAEETASDPTDRKAILWRLVELYQAATDQQRRRADAATADLAAFRRHGLRIVSDPQTPEKGA